MDIAAMTTLGMIFDTDNTEENTEADIMTDLQFKAFIKLMLILAESTGETKEFRKNFGTLSGVNAGVYAPFVTVISRISEVTDDMEKVKQILHDILKIPSVSI